MSNILKNYRKLSSVEYIKVAADIYTSSFAFLLRLSSRYSRMLSGDVIALSQELVDESIKAHNSYPSDLERAKIRESALIEARGALQSLEYQLGFVYLIIAQNPEGSFVNSSERVLSKEDAADRIDKMAISLGNLIDNEEKLLTAEIGKITKIKKKLENQ